MPYNLKWKRKQNLISIIKILLFLKLYAYKNDVSNNKNNSTTYTT